MPRINFETTYSVNQSSLKQVQDSLKSLQKLTVLDLGSSESGGLSKAKEDLKQIKSTASQVEIALDKAFNPKLNSINTEVFNKSLKSANLTIQDVYTNLSKAGGRGESAFAQLSNSVLRTNIQLKQSHKVLDEIAQTLTNTVKWNLSAAAVNQLSRTVQQAVGYAKALDSSLNDIRIVTNQSKEEMDGFAKSANEAAVNLGRSTTDYTDAALIYYQQGLDAEETAARAEVTLKAANVTGQTGQQVSEQLTAVWNGYKVTAEEAELYVDRLAAIAASTASDLEELSTGMSKVAASANSMGVSEEQLASQLSTIISVTRQAPETVGTALKTIYSRMADIKAGISEDDVTLGEYSGKLAGMGIDVLDANKQLRDMGEVMEEVGEKWSTFTREQQVAIAQIMGGARQYTMLTALFENWSNYTETMEVAANAQGTLQQQQDIYMESTRAHLQQLGASMEGLYSSLIDPDTIIGIADAFRAVVDITTNWVDAMGGGLGVLRQLGSAGAIVFRNQLSTGILNVVGNLKTARENADAFEQTLKATQEWQGIKGMDAFNKEALSIRENLLSISGSLKPEEFTQVQTALENFVSAGSGLAEKTQALENLDNVFMKLTDGQKTFTQAIDGSDESTAEFENQIDEISDSLNELQAELVESRKKYVEYRKEVLDNLRTGSAVDKEKLSDSLNNLGNVFDSGNFLKNEDFIKDFFGESALEQIRNFKQEYDKIYEDFNLIPETDDTRQKFNSDLNELRNKYMRFTDELMSKADTTKDVVKESVANGVSAVKADLDEAEQAAEEARAAFEKLFDPLTKRVKLESISSMIGAVSGLTDTVKSYSNIVSSEELDVGEKITQGVSLLPNLIFYITTLNKELGVSKLVLAGAAAAKDAYASSASLATAAQAGFNAVVKANPLMPYIVAIGAVIAGVSALVGWINKLNEEKEEERKKTVEASNAKLEEIEANRALIQTYEDVYQSYKDGTASKQELIDATREVCEELGIERSEAQLAAGQYEVLAEKIRDAKEAKQEEAVAAAAQGFNANAEGLSEDISAKRLTKGGENDYRLFSFDTNKEEELKYAEDFVKRLEDVGIQAEIVDGMLKVTNLTTTKLIENLNLFKATETELSTNSDYGGIDSNIQSILDAANENNYLDEAVKGYGQLKQEIENQLAIEFSDATANSQEEYLKKQQEFINRAKELYNNNKIPFDEVFGSVQEAEDYANSILSTFEGTMMQAGGAALRRTAEENLANTEVKGTDFLDKYDEDTIEVIASMEFNEGQTQESIERQLKFAQEIADANSIKLNVGSITDAIAELQEHDDLSKFKGIAEFKSLLAEMPARYEEYGNALMEFQSLSESGSLKQIEFLQDISDIQGENNLKALQDAEDLYNKYSMTLTELQRRREQLQSSLESGNLEGSEDEVTRQLKDLEDQIYQTTQAKEVLDAQFDHNLTVNVEMDAVDEIIDMGDQFISQAQKMQEAAQLIGEGFQVAASDAEDLFNIFPELADQASMLADGTVRLNQGVVQQVLGDQSLILQGDAETKIAQIDNQIAILEAKKASAEAELALAKSLAQGDVDLEESRIKSISNAREALVNYLMKLGLEETQANQAYVAVMAGNMDKYNEITAGVAGDIDKNLTTAIANAAKNIGANSMISQENLIRIGQAAAEAGASIEAMGQGKSKAPSGVPGINTTVQSTMREYNTAKKQFEAGTLQQATASKPNIDKWIEDVQIDIASYTKGIAQLTALRSKILFAQAQAQNTMNNAASGLGGKYKPSSSSSNKNKGDKDKTQKEKEEKESDYIELLEDEWDIYHDINIQIDSISRELDRVSKAQDKLMGADLINNLNRQLDILEKQKKTYKEKIELAKEEAGALKEALKGFGVTFNEQGQISNYALALQQQLGATNDVIGRYNSLSADQQTEAEKKKVEAAKKQYEELKKLIDNYEELINKTIPDLEDDITDALDKQIEIQIDKFKMSVDLRLDMADAERDWNEFKKKVIDKVKEDDILGNAKADYADLLSYYNTAGGGSGPIQSLTDQINDTLAQLKEMDNSLDKTSSIYGQNRAQAMEDLKKYMDELMSQLTSVQELVDSIEESYLDMIDEASDKFEEQVKGYEFVDDLIEHNKNVIELLYGEDAYGEMDKFYERQEKNNSNNLDFLRKEADFWLQKMQAEEEGSEAWKAYKENWENAIKDLNSGVEDSIQTIIDRYTNLINKVFDDLNNKVTNGMGLDYVNEEWDLIKQNADEYLDTINASFAIDKLRGKFQDALNNTDGLQNQKRLNDLMQQQLGDLETREKLTQYDVERAEKLLDIEIKRIALQDAQKNKSKMRLKRDASGNYSYQFVSDEESILQAQQDLADAQNSLYNFDKNAYQENLNGIYDIYSEFQNKLMELYADQILTEEEREARKALLVEQYQELLTAKTEQNTQIRNNLEDSAFQELAKMYGVNVNEFQNMVDEQKNILLGDLIPGWNDGIQQMIDKFASEGGLIPVCSDAFKELEEVTNQYKDSLKDLQETGGVSFDDLANGYDKNIDLANKLQQENQELINQYDQQIAAIQRVIQEVQSLANMYDLAYKNAVNASKAAYLYWQEQNRQDAEEAKKNGGGASSSASGGNGTSTSGSGSGNAGGGANSSSGSGSGGSGGSAASPGKSVTVDNIKVGDKLKYTGGLYYYDSWGSGPAGDRGAGNTVTVSNIAKGNKYPISVTSANSAYGWLLPSQLQRLKTGGYTGEWGASGKLAMLHEKELVLNASDTKNMLDAVSVVRSITDSFSNNIFNMLGTFSGNAQNIMDVLNPGSGAVNNTTINAEFPNVTNHNEIEEAIKNLSNIASQRAMKNNKR